MLSKLAASLGMTLASLALLAALSRVTRRVAPAGAAGFGPETLALVAAVTFALGTSVWSAASQALWSHTSAVFGYALALWGIVAGFGGIAGVAAGLAAVARPATAPAALLLVGYLVHRAARSHPAGNVAATETRQALRSVLGLALTAGSGVLFNLMIFGSVGGGAAGRTSNWVEEFGAPNMFAGSLLTGLAGLTVSPSRGILVFSPILVLALVGGYRVWRTRLATLSTREAQDAVLLGRYATLGSVAILNGVLAVSRLVGGTRLWSSILDRPDAAGGPALCVRTCRPGATGSGGSHDPAHAEATVGRGRRAVRLLHRDSGARCILLAVSLDARRCFRLRRSSLGLAGQPDRLLYPCGASGRPDGQTSL